MINWVTVIAHVQASEPIKVLKYFPALLFQVSGSGKHQQQRSRLQQRRRGRCSGGWCSRCHNSWYHRQRSPALSVASLRVPLWLCSTVSGDNLKDAPGVSPVLSPRHTMPSLTPPDFSRQWHTPGKVISAAFSTISVHCKSQSKHTAPERHLISRTCVDWRHMGPIYQRFRLTIWTASQ